jgi:hypothetical protein
LEIIRGSSGCRPGWGVVGCGGHVGGQVGDRYEEGDVWVRGADRSRETEEGG